MWNDLIACTAYVYAWNVEIRNTPNADLALSMNDYVDRLPKHSKSRRILFASDDIHEDDDNL
jgi:hypothetical protein